MTTDFNSKPISSAALAVGLCLQGATASAQDAEPLRVAAISGYFNQGFGIAMVDGLNHAVEDFGVELRIVDTGNRVLDYQQQFDDLTADNQYDLIFVMGWELVDALETSADAHPGQRFVFIDGVLESDTITYVDFLEEQGSFLVGTLAAELVDRQVAGFDSSGELGFIGGRDIPVIRNFQSGMEQGIAFAAPGVELAAVYAGTFDDPARGSELALTLFGQGIDIVYQAAGPTGEGVLQAAAAADRYAVGVDIDQCATAPGNILASMLKRADSAVYDMIKGEVTGDDPVEPGTVEASVATGGIELRICDEVADLIPPEVSDRVEEVRAGIADGSIEVRLGQR